MKLQMPSKKMLKTPGNIVTVSTIGRPSGNTRRVHSFTKEIWNCYDAVPNRLPRTNNSIGGWHQGVSCFQLEEAEEKDRIQNVENWTEYVTPLLSQAKSRSNFDIKKYGQDILSQFSEIGSELSFHSITENKRSDFTARNFLSMFMLANTEKSLG